MHQVLFAFEVKHWLLRPATLSILALWTGLLGYAAWSGSLAVQQQQARLREHLAEEGQRHRDLVARMDSFARGTRQAKLYWEDHRNAFDVGSLLGTRTLGKQPAPLAAVSLGQTHLFATSNLVTTNNGYWFMALRKPERMDNPASQLLGPFDLAFALIWLFPLVVIALTFNVLSLEQEQGTLPMLLVQGIGVSGVVRRKIAFRGAVLTVLTLLATLGFLTAFGNPVWQAGSGWVLLGLSVLLYSAVWHLAAAGINYLGKSSNFNLGLLFVSWLGGVVLLPILLNVFVNTFYRIPAKTELVNHLRETLTAYDRQNSALLDQYYTDHPEVGAKDSAKIMPLFMYKLAIREMSTAEAMHPVIGQYKSQVLAQQSLIRYWSYLSPAVLGQESLEELSGNSTRQLIEFQQAADGVNRQWRQYFFPLAMDSRMLSVADFKRLPYPSYQTSVEARNVIWLLMGLLAWTILLGVWALRQERRYQLNR